MATNVDAIDLHQEHAKSNYLERAFLSSPNQIRLIGDLRRTAVRLSTYRSPERVNDFDTPGFGI